MKKGVPVLLCGLAAILITVVLYLIVFGTGVWGAIHFVSLSAVVLAEIITTAYAWFSKGSVRKVAAAIFSGIMIPFSAVLSGVYIVNFPRGYGKYLGWYFAGTLVVNVICLILLSFDSSKKDENDQLQSSKSNMLMLRKLVKSILANPAAQQYQKELNALEEKLHFSNDNVICAEDEQIRLLLLQLQEKVQNQESDCTDFIEKIALKIDQRNIMSSRTI